MIKEAEFRNAFDIDLPPGIVVFCDLDGTLVDTDYANYLSYKKAVLEATHRAVETLRHHKLLKCFTRLIC